MILAGLNLRCFQGGVREAGSCVNSQPSIHCFEAVGSLENSPAVSTCLMRKKEKKKNTFTPATELNAPSP